MPAMQVGYSVSLYVVGMVERDHLNKKWTRNLSLTLLTLQSLNWNHDSSHWVDANNFNIFIAQAWAPGTNTHWRLDASTFILNH